jgi:hypothetical protein
MANTRGWTFEETGEEESENLSEADQDARDADYEKRREIVDGLVGRWNQIHNQLEEEGWRMQSLARGERDYEYDEDENPAREMLRKIRLESLRNELSAIEEALGELGARMMRPYEHWNEDEKYMEYMERDRDDEY